MRYEEYAFRNAWTAHPLQSYRRHVAGSRMLHAETGRPCPRLTCPSQSIRRLCIKIVGVIMESEAPCQADPTAIGTTAPGPLGEMPQSCLFPCPFLAGTVPSQNGQRDGYERGGTVRFKGAGLGQAARPGKVNANRCSRQHLRAQVIESRARIGMLTVARPSHRHWTSRLVISQAYAGLSID